MHHEISHGREISWAMRAKEAPEHIKADWPGSAWIVELLASGSRDGKPFKARHLFITSLRTNPEALLRLIRERWSIENWHWIRDTQFHEDKHRYRGKPASPGIYTYCWDAGRIEQVFGWIKQAAGLRQLKARGRSKVGAVFRLHVVAYNLIRLANLLSPPEVMA